MTYNIYILMNMFAAGSGVPKGSKLVPLSNPFYLFNFFAENFLTRTFHNSKTIEHRA